MRLYRSFLAVVFLSFSVFSLSFPVFVLGYSESDATQALTSAQRSIRNCYLAVVEAEKAGANVTRLVDRLNVAGELYSRATLAYSRGDYDLTVSLCEEAQAKLSGLTLEAESLRMSALEEGRRDFLYNVVGSSVGAVAVVCVSAVLWTLLKRRGSEVKGEG